MNLRSIVSLEFVKNNKNYSFNLPFGVVFSECYEVLKEVEKELQDMEIEQKKQAEEAAKLEAAKQKPIDPELVNKE